MNTENTFIQQTLKKFLVPTIIALLGTTLSAFGNTLLAGRFLGKEALSMMSILSSFTFLYAMLGCLISIGASVRSSIALGSEDYKTAAKYEWLSFVLSLVVPIVMSIPFILFFDKFFMFLGADASQCALGAIYGRLIIAFGFLNTLLYFPFNFLRLIGKAKYGMYCFGAMGIIDLILVYLFLRLGMGTVGLALGYIISMVIANAAGLFFLFTKNNMFKPMKPNSKELQRMLLIIMTFGSSSAVNNLCKMLRTMFMNMLVAKYFGKDGVSSLAVGFSIINLASASVTGYGQAISPIIGVFHGEHDVEGQRQTLKTSIRGALIFHTILAIIIIILAPQISEAFGISGAEHVRDTAVVVRLVAISLIPSAVMNILIYYYNAIKQNNGALILTFMHAFVLLVLFANIHLLFDKSPLYALSFITAELIDFAIMYLYAKVCEKKNPSLKGILLEEQNYSEKFFSVVSDGTKEGVSTAYESVAAFCEENDVDTKLCLKIPLAVEELLVVLANHCCLEDNQHIDIRISILDNNVVMRLRCQGRIFNPIDWYKERKNNLPLEEFMEDESFGMGVVEKIATRVDYSNMFDVNNLIVTMEAK